MPMYNGNYVAPVWINNVPPAINDTELLAISRTLQNSQIITGSGAPTQYTSGVAGQRYADMDTTPTLSPPARGLRTPMVYEGKEATSFTIPMKKFTSVVLTAP